VIVEPEEGDLREQLHRVLQQTVALHPGEHRAALLPVMDAVARVLASRHPGFQPPRMALDAEGAPVVEGPDGERFLALWKADIALDAAASMIVRNLGPSGDQIDETALAALVRRVEKLLARATAG
jgi:hypothetical protein